MGLLWLDYGTEFQNLVDIAFRLEQGDENACFADLSARVQKIVYRDTRYNIDFLYTAFVLDDSLIIEKYAVWLYELMTGVLGDKPQDAVLRYVVNHLEYIARAVPLAVDPDKVDGLVALVRHAQESVTAYADAGMRAPAGEPVRFEHEVNQYLECLLAHNTRKAMSLVQGFLRAGISVEDIYIEILAESMRRVGEMWHKGTISVDTEHYCTSTTQVAMSMMYPLIFSTERCGKKILCACPGAELHEMSARMVADIFENNGWDSVYLGAAVPASNLIDAIRDNDPDVVALSVTMPQYLIDCEAVVRSVKERFPNVVVAVGGNAFENTQEIWKKWPVDIHVADARELLSAAERMVGEAK